MACNQPAGKYRFRLINYLGLPVLSRDIIISSPNVSYSLPLNSRLTPGYYLLEAIDPSGRQITA